MKKLSIQFVLPLFIYSCGQNSTTQTSSTDSSTVEIIEPIQDEALVDLHLNNGAKWLVDSTTATGMANVETIVSNFDGVDFVTLGTTVKTELSSIINQCTMKGEDHNQYHIVLHALMTESKALIAGTSTNDEKLKRYLAAYQSHFTLP